MRRDPLAVGPHAGPGVVTVAEEHRSGASSDFARRDRRQTWPVVGRKFARRCVTVVQAKRVIQPIGKSLARPRRGRR
jgi:hypothetical protein